MSKKVLRDSGRFDKIMWKPEEKEDKLMPYIAIKGYPKDDETKRKLVERINDALLDLWGCPQEAISISVEEIAPEQWEERIVKGEIEPNADKMMILSGKKRYGAKKLTLFHLADCPYCHKARRAFEELQSEEPAYRAVEVEWVEEREQPALADRYDYYHVPAVFAGERKLYEASPGEGYDEIKANIRRALDAV